MTFEEIKNTTIEKIYLALRYIRACGRNLANKLNRGGIFRSLAPVLIILLLLFTSVIKIKKHRVVRSRKTFFEALENLTNRKDVEVYNLPKINKNLLNSNDYLIILNIYGRNDPKFHNALAIAADLSERYDNVLIFDFIIKNENEAELDSIYDSLIGDSTGDFIEKYAINRPLLVVSEEVLKKTIAPLVNVDDMVNKIVVLDRKYQVKFALANDLGRTKINDFLVDSKISTKTKKKRTNSRKFNSGRSKTEKNRTKKVDNESANCGKKISLAELKPLASAMNHLLVIDEAKIFSFPVLALVDTVSNNVLIIKFNGEIIQLLDCDMLHIPSGISYNDGKLFLTDAYDGSVWRYNFMEKKLELFLKNPQLEGIGDFKPLDDGNYLISKSSDGSLGIFDGENYEELDKKLGLDYKLNSSGKIIECDGGYYYFDRNQKILYRYDNDKFENRKLIDFGAVDLLSYGDISGFYVNSENNIYFLDKTNHCLIHFNGNKIEENSFNGRVFSPNDFLIHKNVFFVLSDEYVQKFDIYHDEYHQIIPNLTESSSYVGDLNYKKIAVNSIPTLSRNNFTLENIFASMEGKKINFTNNAENGFRANTGKKHNGENKMEKSTDHNSSHDISVNDVGKIGGSNGYFTGDYGYGDNNGNAADVAEDNYDGIIISEDFGSTRDISDGGTSYYIRSLEDRSGDRKNTAKKNIYGGERIYSSVDHEGYISTSNGEFALLKPSFLAFFSGKKEENCDRGANCEKLFLKKLLNSREISDREIAALLNPDGENAVRYVVGKIYFRKNAKIFLGNVLCGF